jgi:hypothetical protein
MWGKKATDVHNKIADGAYESKQRDKEGEIKIEHITYDESHRKVDARASVSQKAKIYISRLSGGSDKLKGTLAWGPKSPDPCNSLIPRNTWSKAQWSAKEWRHSFAMMGKHHTDTTVGNENRDEHSERRKMPMKGPKKKGLALADAVTNLPTREERSLELSTRDREEAVSPLSMNVEEATAVAKKYHKSSFCDIVTENFSQTLGEMGQHRSKIEKETDMEKILALRRRMKAGELEKVVRPLSPTFENEGQLAPSPPLTPSGPSIKWLPAIHTKPHKSIESACPRCPSRDRKSASTSSMIVSFLESGAEALDETRRELQHKFKPPFENFNYSSLSLSRKAARFSEESSEESFHCIGNKEDSSKSQKVNTKAIGELKERQSVRRRAEVWTKAIDETKPCRLCGRMGVPRLRNICRDCKTEFLQRKGRSRPSIPPLRAMVSEKNDNIGLTPPKEEPKMLLGTSEMLGSSRFDETFEVPETRPPVPRKSRARMLAVSTAYTPVLEPKPYHPLSQDGEIELR